MSRSNAAQPRALMETLDPRLLFAIELDIVALHEFGHSLGLQHHPDTAANSIMEAFYNPNYNKANLATDVAVAAVAGDGYTDLLELFSDAGIAANTTSWKDSLDGNANGTVNVTYSFMPDGNKLDSNKRNVLFATLNAKFGSPSVWQPMLAAELNRWAAVSSGNLSFQQVSDNGANAGAAGAAQGDSRFGDIRIGSHRFDGRGGVLAHAYFPPPNGGTIAGDAHFASEEDWSNGGALMTVGSFIVLPDGRLYCPIGEHGHDHNQGGGSALGLVATVPASLFGEGTIPGSGSGMDDLFGSEGALVSAGPASVLNV